MALQNKRVLYLYDGKLKDRGLDEVVKEQLLALVDGGAKVTLVSRGRLDQAGIINRQHPFPLTKLFSSLSSDYYYPLNKRYFSWLGAHQLSKEPYDAVIAWSKSAYRLFQAAKTLKIPTLLNVGNFHCQHRTDPQPQAPQHWPKISGDRLQQEYAFSSHILVASDYAAETFSHHGVPEEKLRVLYRGVNLAVFQHPPQKPERPFIVAMAGRIGERKGAPQLLQAWREADIKDGELWLIGSVGDKDKQTLSSQAIDTVKFLGQRSDIADLLGQAHVHVLLSRNEGLAKVQLEAAACGAVNLCTREGGFPIQNGINGFLIKNRDDTQAIAQILRQLYSQPPLRNELADNACQLMLNSFTWSHFRQRFVTAVAESLAGDRRS